MTDDGTPIELSWGWDFARQEQAPMVRFSIEPIGLYAGSSLDALNVRTGLTLFSRLQHILPHYDLEWFEHFSNHLLVQDKTANNTLINETQISHQSQIFAAFDLQQNGILAKAYFLPSVKAAETGLSKLDLMARSISRLQGRNGTDLEAFNVLQDFILSSAHLRIDAEILAIDCVVPDHSRLKIYVRSPQTSFDSVCQIMTLGDESCLRLLSDNLNELRHLWDAVMSTGVRKDSCQPLEYVAHRTAGILYNFEIRPGKQEIVPKVYIPVRHYGQSDLVVMSGFQSWLQHCKYDGASNDYKTAFMDML